MAVPPFHRQADPMTERDAYPKRVQARIERVQRELEGWPIYLGTDSESDRRILEAALRREEELRLARRGDPGRHPHRPGPQP